MQMSHQQQSLNASFPGSVPESTSDMEVDEYTSSNERIREEIFPSTVPDEGMDVGVYFSTKNGATKQIKKLKSGKSVRKSDMKKIGRALVATKKATQKLNPKMGSIFNRIAELADQLRCLQVKIHN
ncbi:unnamed protein product [Allacma fusca]|uniref:Uncharacterized protein n=1 Tax=Allacma fusca TaxID=39272 RepID=A0A8J2P296_9HEXA|nr:unnamed protein product [Allacma fusca]